MERMKAKFEKKLERKAGASRDAWNMENQRAPLTASSFFGIMQAL
jgi:hypothetical protein